MTVPPNLNGGNPNDDGADFLDDPNGTMDDEPVIECLAEITPTALKWIWKGFIPLGKLSILEGESDVGKSTASLDWAQIVSNGSVWPTTTIKGKELKRSQRDPAGVILVGVEDGYSDTVVPRLIANGSNRNKIHRIKRAVDSKGKPVPFVIPDDIDRLRQAIVQAKAELVIIDPITAYLSDKVLHGVDSSIRKQLTPLAELADETGCAIVLIRHFNKDSKASAKNRGGGSVAYGAVVRSVMQAAPLPVTAANGSTHAIVVPIGNLTKKPDAQGYRIVNAPEIPELPVPEDDELRIGLTEWCGTVDYSPDELLNIDDGKRDARKNAPVFRSARESLIEILRNGPVLAQEAMKRCKQASGASTNTVYKASEDLAVLKEAKYKPDGGFDCWTWRLGEVFLAMLKSEERTESD